MYKIQSGIHTAILSARPLSRKSSYWKRKSASVPIIPTINMSAARYVSWMMNGSMVKR